MYVRSPLHPQPCFLLMRHLFPAFFLFLLSPSSPKMTTSPPQVCFSPDVSAMAEWASRTGIPLTSAEAMGTLYARAHRWMIELKLRLTQDCGWREIPSEPRMLFSIEGPPPRSANGLPRTPPLRLQLPQHATSFFSPERRVQWEMVFHSAIFPVMRHSVQPIGDILHLLQCLLTGMVVLVKEDNIPGEGIYKTIRALPPAEWISSNQASLVEVFGQAHFKKLFKAASDKRVAFKLIRG